MEKDLTVKYRVILSGGGTGGHIYPAVAVAQALEEKLGDQVEILFVGAENKMEMEKIPALGYNIKGLPVAGLQRKLTASNLALPMKISRSIRKAKEIIREFKADIVVGFGGYASGPVLWSAQRMGIPTIIQEQNSYAGLTNKILGKRANSICVAYDEMNNFFPAGKIVFTGNPLRNNFSQINISREEALAHFGLNGSKKTILVLGGSLGTRTLNNAVKKWFEENPAERNVQLIWQTGKYYYDEMAHFMDHRNNNGIWFGAFIDRMDLAYSAADVVVSRAGANTVSELCLVGKPTVFVPSPNVTDDHQTKNAMALCKKEAALMVSDAEAVDKVFSEVTRLLEEDEKMSVLSSNMRQLARPDSAHIIAGMIIEMIAHKTERHER